jgi:hypothetical protein
MPKRLRRGRINVDDVSALPALRPPAARAGDGRAATRFECDVAYDSIEMAREAERLDGDRFAAQTAAFAIALERDLIDASDFS